MARHRLSPEDARLWGRVAATVRPMAGRAVPAAAPEAPASSAAQRPTRAKVAPAAPVAVRPVLASAVSRPSANTLDASWDRRLLGGHAQPDRTIDLHGHTLASAHALLDQSLANAIQSGARLILLITGRPARDNPRMPPTRRGVIRASIEDWIRAGPHAARIAAIRGAHPRHGGAGALYLVLRRDRTG